MVFRFSADNDKAIEILRGNKVRILDGGVRDARQQIDDGKDSYKPQAVRGHRRRPVGVIVAAFSAKGGYDVTLCDVGAVASRTGLDPGASASRGRHPPGGGREDDHPRRQI